LFKIIIFSGVELLETCMMNLHVSTLKPWI